MTVPILFDLGGEPGKIRVTELSSPSRLLFHMEPARARVLAARLLRMAEQLDPLPGEPLVLTDPQALEPQG